MLKERVVVQLKTGLHARPAARFVQTASDFRCKITIEKGNNIVNAKSIMGIMALGVDQGEEIVIRTEGEDEQAALETLLVILASFE